MIKKHRTAFNKLKKIGIAVREPMEWDNEGHYGVFWIDCEQCDDITPLHADYFNNFWGSKELNDTLKEAGLYFQWVNAGYASCHEI